MGESSEKTTPAVIIEKQGGVGTIILNRPEKRNALDLTMRKAIAEAVKELNEDNSILCLLVTGGDDVFAAGADLNMLVSKGAQEVAELNLGQYWEPLVNCPKPVISAVSGYALGAGCELVMMSDIVIADQSARFGQPEANVGIMPGAGGTQRLIRAVGKPIASMMLLCGEILDAQRALQAGLVSDVVANGETIHRAQKLAKRITKMPPKAMLAIKRTLAIGADIDLGAAIAIENREFLLLFDTKDKTEGMTAFLEKRKPEYSGK
ncbi:enoyl-CoA hydratase-related protein [Alteromonas sp. M12]|uniref:enoyl-CoA hydratase-related protein n=1 Tax=Alteromonas sp. M12 TaxID=3135644 RepID=UPI00319E0EC7